MCFLSFLLHRIKAGFKFTYLFSSLISNISKENIFSKMLFCPILICFTSNRKIKAFVWLCASEMNTVESNWKSRSNRCFSLPKLISARKYVLLICNVLTKIDNCHQGILPSLQHLSDIFNRFAVTREWFPSLALVWTPVCFFD